MKSVHWNVAVVGAGRVGQVFGRVLREAGDTITAVVSRSRSSARRGGRFLDCRNAGTALRIIPEATDLVLLTTPHSAVEDTARAIARLGHLSLTRMAFCHASGMLTAAALEPLAAQGAAVFSFHPLQTFPRDFDPAEIVPSLRGIWYGVDGDARALRTARQLARHLGGKTVEIPPDRRAYYHAACVVASNHLTGLLSVLEDMHRTLDLEKPDFMALFRPIIEATLNNVASASPAEALSGPVARGGLETVTRHFDAIRAYSPMLLPYYAAMTLETVQLALRKGSIDAAQAEGLERLVASHLASATRTEVHE